MDVSVLCKCGARMAQPFAYYLCILPGSEKKCGARMTQVIQTYVGKVRLLEYRLEVSSVEVPNQDRRPRTGGKYQVVVLILIAGLQPLFKLFSPMALKLAHHVRRNRDRSSTLRGLRFFEVPSPTFVVE